MLHSDGECPTCHKRVIDGHPPRSCPQIGDRVFDPVARVWGVVIDTKPRFGQHADHWADDPRPRIHVEWRSALGTYRSDPLLSEIERDV